MTGICGYPVPLTASERKQVAAKFKMTQLDAPHRTALPKPTELDQMAGYLRFPQIWRSPDLFQNTSNQPTTPRPSPSPPILPRISGNGAARTSGVAVLRSSVRPPGHRTGQGSENVRNHSSGKGRRWPETDSNRRHVNFQSTALPTELSGHSLAGGAGLRVADRILTTGKLEKVRMAPDRHGVHFPTLFS